MKQLLFFLCFSFFYSFSQKNTSNYFDAQVLRGNIYKHRNDIAHLISGHPDGFYSVIIGKPTDQKNGIKHTTIPIMVFRISTSISKTII